MLKKLYEEYKALEEIEYEAADKRFDATEETQEAVDQAWSDALDNLHEKRAELVKALIEERGISEQEANSLINVDRVF